MEHRSIMGQVPIDAAYPPPPVMLVARADRGRAVGGAGSIRSLAAAPSAPPPAGRLIDAAVMQVMVAAAVRQTLDHPMPESDAAPASDGDDADGAVSPVDFDAAVIAAHEQRIALLRDRLSSLCASDGRSPLLAGLRQRLRRAEQARRVAVTRAGIGADAVGRGGDPGPTCARLVPVTGQAPRDRQPRYLVARAHPPAAVVAHRRAVPASVAIRYVASIKPVHRHHPPPGRGMIRIAAVSHHQPTMVRSWRAGIMVGASTNARLTALAMTPAGLSRARRSLVAARAALAGVPATPRPAPLLAGPWWWNGGDRWHPASATGRRG